MDRRLQRLQNRTNGLREFVSGGVPPEMSQLLACESLVSELREEQEALTTEFSNPTTPALRKLSKDFARLLPAINDTLKLANQACFDARYAIEEQNRKAEVREDRKPVTYNPPVHETENNAVTSTRGQQKKQQQVVKFQDEDDVLVQQTEKELKVIEAKAQTIHTLTQDVAKYVANSADDAGKVSSHSSSARDDVVAGLGELAEAKKREAGKHTTRGTTVSAVIGGAVGLVGGPIGVAFGAAAGAAVGAAIGSSITSMSRRSIDREIRAFKDKFKVEVRPDGSCVTHAEIFENERWSLSRRMWSSDHLLPTDFRSKWTIDEMGNPVGVDDPSPINPDATPKAPLMKKDKPKQIEFENQALPSKSPYDDLEVEEEKHLEVIGESYDGSFAGAWRWAQNSKWMPDVYDRNADVNGWRYAFSFADGAVWYPEPNRTCLVRKRRWIRDQILDPQKAVHPERIALIVMARKRAEADSRIQKAIQNFSLEATVPLNREGSRHLNQAMNKMDESVRTSYSVLEELRKQGMQINDASFDVAIVEDASSHAQRVSRAVTMSGVLRNAFSRSPDAVEKVVARREKSQSNGGGFEINPRSVDVDWDHPVTVLEKLCDEQLQVSKVIHEEVESQNKNLDQLAKATTRSEGRLVKAKNMI